MKFKHSIFVICGLSMMFSCTTMKKSTSTTISVNSSVLQYPTVADLDVHKKAETTVKWGFVPFNWGQPPLELRQKNLTADMIKDANADILLEPQIVFTKQPYGERTLTITGYPATFKNFRKATNEDLEALKAVDKPSERKVHVISQPWYKKIIGKLF